MLVEWQTLDIQNDSLAIDLSEEHGLAGLPLKRLPDGYPKQVV
jgi:hypothetical protein